jgi:hypothetical protein
VTEVEGAHPTVGTRDWVRRRGPSWVLQGASAASAAVALAGGAHALAAAVCWALVVLEGGLLLATAVTLWRIRRLVRARFRGAERAPGRPQRRIVRAEGLVLGLAAVLAGLDATYTYRPAAVGLALVFFGAQLLYDRRARR